MDVTFDKRNFLLRIYGVTLSVIVLYIFLYFLFEVPFYRVVMLSALAVALVVGLLITIKGKRNNLSPHYYIICCYILFCFSGVTTGGLENPGVIWFMICPLIGLLTLSTRVARFWLGAVLLTLCLFYFLKNYIVIDVFRGGSHWYLVTYLIFFPTVYSFLQIFRIEISKKTIKQGVLNDLLCEKQERLEYSQQELIKQRDRLQDAESIAVKRNNKLGDYLNHLLEISRMEEMHIGNLQYSIESVQRTLLNAMNLDSVSMWHLDDGTKNLNLIGSLGNAGNKIYQPGNLTKENFSEAFEMLEAGAVIVTPDDRMESPQLTLEIQGLSHYASMIGCPYFIDGKFGGFINCRSRERVWTAEDIIFVRAVSDALPLAFKSYQRKNHQLLLEKKQSEIIELNESLENKVVERTTELKVRNEQLLNFAFINAHKIRGPICRLLGLRDLLLRVSNPSEVMTIGVHMSSSIEELDAITRSASKLLSESINQDDLVI